MLELELAADEESRTPSFKIDAEVGLPTAEIPLALFSFNVGIELGQLAFVAVVLLVAAALRKVSVAWP